MKHLKLLTILISLSSLVGCISEKDLVESKSTATATFNNTQSINYDSQLVGNRVWCEETSNGTFSVGFYEYAKGGSDTVPLNGIVFTFDLLVNVLGSRSLDGSQSSDVYGIYDNAIESPDFTRVIEPCLFDAESDGNRIKGDFTCTHLENDFEETVQINGSFNCKL